MDNSDYIVLSRFNVCSIVIFSGVKLTSGVGDNLAGTAVKTIGVL